MSGYCPDCGNTFCICDSDTRATYPYRVKILELESKNKKLREALEFYADRKNCDNPDFAHVEIDEHGDEIADGGYRAREALKELEDK